MKPVNWMNKWLLQKLQQPLSMEQCRIKCRIWQQITDIFAECSIDYDKDSDTPIAKKYLDEKQIRQLERAVTGYF